MRTLFFSLCLSILATATAHADVTGTITGTVDAKPAKFLGETVVYLEDVTVKHTAKTVMMDQQGMAFSPMIVIVTIGDTVTFMNHDKVQHNVMSPDSNYDLGAWGENESKSYTFKTKGVFAQLCRLHPEMHGWVFVGQNSFATTVDASGNFTIANVPAGTYTISIWNSHLKAASQKVTVKASAKQAVTFSLKR
jgi:plastocyanin